MPNFFPRSCKLTLDFDSAQERGILVFARLRLVLRLLLPGLPLLERGGERVFQKIRIPPRWWSRARFSRLVLRCFFRVAGVSPVFRWCLLRGLGRPYESSLLVLGKERTGWSVEYPTVGDEFFLDPPGPDSTVAPGVKSVLEPFERGPVHGEREMKSSHWKSLSPIRVPCESERL